MTLSCKINIDIAQRDGFHKKKDEESVGLLIICCYSTPW
jgi:hypothetical protein